MSRYRKPKERQRPLEPPAPTRRTQREIDILAMRLHVIPSCLYGARVPYVYGHEMGNHMADRILLALVKELF